MKPLERIEPSDPLSEAVTSFRGLLARAVLLSLLAVLPPCPAPAAPVRELTDRPWQVTSFIDDAELAGRYVFDLTFETNGALWLAASDGLRRYDGYRWEHYTTNSGLPSSFVRCVLLARDGTLWVGTDRGAGVFDPQTRRFDARNSERGLAGPSVRRIRQAPDNSLWFCSDRWPETTRAGGLASLASGVWKRYQVADGLPSDDVMNVAWTSKGRQFVMTHRGVAERQGEQWRPLTQPGLPEATLTWAVAEAPDGTLLAHVDDRQSIFALRDGYWQRVRGDVLSMFVTSTGEIRAADFNRQLKVAQLLRWDGALFTPVASASIRFDRTAPQEVRQAPDGAFWLVGPGLLVRWQPAGGEWAAYAGLPPPQFLDPQGALWFADEQQVIRRTKDGFEVVPDLHGPLWADRTNGVWACAGSTLVLFTHTNRSAFPPDDTGLHRVNGCIQDFQGGTWFHGRDAQDRLALARFDGRHWLRLSVGRIAPLVVRDAAADPAGGVWLVLREKSGRACELAFARGDAVDLQSFPGGLPPLSNPSLAIDGNGFWLWAYAGLYRMPLDRSAGWRRVEELPVRALESYAPSGDASVFLFLEDESSHAGAAVYRGNRWTRFPADLTTQSIVCHRAFDGSVLFGDEGGFYILRPQVATDLDYVPLPLAAAIHVLLKDREGNVWIGTSEGTLRFRLSPDPPATLLTGSAHAIQEHESVRFEFRGLKRWVPGSAKPTCQYSVRLDSGAWSPFSRTTSITLADQGLRPGFHRFEARARDADGRADEKGALFAFRVLSTPLQERPWFKWVVGGIVVVIGALATSASRRARQTARANASLRLEVSRRQQVETELQQAQAFLEERVRQRTDELSNAIASLRCEVAERKQAEERIRQLAQEQRTVLHTIKTGISFLKHREHQWVNPAFAAMFGYEVQEVKGLHASVFYASEEDCRRVGQEGYAQLAAAGIYSTEALMKRKDGTRLWCSITGQAINPQNLEEGSIWALHDITERKQSEIALKASEAAFRSLFEAGPAAVAMMVDRKFHRINALMTQLSGYSEAELLGHSVRMLYASEQDFLQTGQVLYGRIEREGVGMVETRFRRKDGTLLDVLVCARKMESGGDIDAVATTCLDITERKRAEDEREKLRAQLMQAQKMESVGRLAGGVAHDFNNMLQAILGNADLALDQVPPGSPVRESLEEIRKSAERSADLTRQLLAYARKQTIQPKVLDLNEFLPGILNMLRRLIGENIALVWTPGLDLWSVRMDPSQLDQILANLCVNARDAIDTAGKLTIETSNVTFDDTYAGTHPDCLPGDYVMLAVSDTGRGMDAETRAHLFEPFFTTKALGQGTGLGLATVFGIVKQNRGLINVYSEPGRGTTFKIYLPRAEVAAAAPAAAALQRLPDHGTETLLLVEDEEQILRLGQRILRHRGYTVLTAASPAAALALVAECHEPIHLLIADVVMPDMNGRELWERMLELKPGLRCLFMSGYTADVIAHHGVLNDGVRFLQKPFTAQSLTEQVREALREPPKP